MVSATKVQVIQKAADESLDAVYACEAGTPELAAARAVYRGHVETLVGLLGDDAPCSEVDPDLHQFFYDAYSDEYGHKPRGSRITREDATAWIEARRDEEGVIRTLAEINGKKSQAIQASILANGIGEKAPSALAQALQMAGVALSRTN